MISVQHKFFPAFFLSILLALASGIYAAPIKLKTGIEVLAREHPDMVRGKKIAMLTSRTAIDMNHAHSIDRLAKAASIKLIFTGDSFFRETMPGDDPTTFIDALTNARVIEISDPLKRPAMDVFQDADLLIIDFQDIGIRYFKYLTLMAQFLDVAREASIPVLVLDRPNPINGTTVAGPVLEVSLRSRFGVYPIPLIHGMTIGEIALYFNKAFGLGANLTVIGMEGYQRNYSYNDTGLHWVPPSDHIPEADSTLYYAATGFLGELGVFSTGVGTNRPFHFVMAPWIDGELLSQRLERHKLPGIKFVPAHEKIYYGLFSQKTLPGIELIVTDRFTYDPFLCGMAILKNLFELYPERIPLGNPAAAEALDTLLGSAKIRQGIMAGQPLLAIYSALQADLGDFIRKRREYLIYPE